MTFVFLDTTLFLAITFELLILSQAWVRSSFHLQGRPGISTGLTEKLIIFLYFLSYNLCHKLHFGLKMCTIKLSISTLPSHIYSTILSYAKVTCNTHTHKNKKLLSIPLKLVPSLAKLPSPVTPFPLGGAPPTPNTSHSSFWRHQSNSSVSPLLTFVRCR